METRFAKARGCADMSASLVPPPVPADCLHGFFYSNTGKKKVAFLLKKTKHKNQKTNPTSSPAVQHCSSGAQGVNSGCLCWLHHFLWTS